MSDPRPLRFLAYSSETDLRPNRVEMTNPFLRTFLNSVAELVPVEVELVVLEVELVLLELVVVVVEPDLLVLVPVQVVGMVDLQYQDLSLHLLNSERSLL